MAFDNYIEKQNFTYQKNHEKIRETLFTFKALQCVPFILTEKNSQKNFGNPEFYF